MFRLLVLSAVVVTVASPAVARMKSDSLPSDPNKLICRTEDVVGSRLQTKKTCMTAPDWDRLEQQQRHTVERIQSLKPSGAK